MKTCSLNDFMESVKPWLSTQYIRAANLDEKENLVLSFNDGVKNIYHIDDCTLKDIKDILKDFKKRGIAVSE